MATGNYTDLLPKVLAHEGGYVNHPKDPGGATNKGVTQATYDKYRRSKKLPLRSVKLITMDEVREIYKRDYWDVNRCDQLPAGLDYPVFDSGINSGPSRGAKWLQQALGVKADGQIGPATLFAADAVRDKAITARKACEIRRSFLTSLSTFKTFGKGWLRRVADVEAHSVALALLAAGRANTVAAAELEALGKINEQRSETAGKQAGTAAAGGGVTATGTALPSDMVPFDASFYWVLGAAAVVLLIVALVLVRKSRAERLVSEAYAAKAQELVQA